MATEWDEVLAEKGIKPRKEVEITEQEIVELAEKVAEKNLASKNDKYQNKSLKELDEFSGDDEEEKTILEFRRKRIQEMKEQMTKARFGDVREISAENYKAEVNKAGKDIWVLLLLYETSSPICTILQEYWRNLAQKFPSSKFLKSEAHLCVPNFPAKNLPAIFVYFEDELKAQFVGPSEFSRGDKSPISIEDLEWKLNESGAIKSSLTEKPKPKRTNITTKNGILLGSTRRKDSSEESDDDW